MPFFSIVIPTYNRAEKLKVTIDSVLNQSFQDFELLIMDDGSTDHTESIIESYNDSRIYYTKEGNSGGPATPRNNGLALAKGIWVSFLDADDIWYPDRLKTVFQAISLNPSYDLFSHNEILFDVQRGTKVTLFYGPYENDFYKVLLTNGNRLSTSAVTIRVDILRQNNLKFNEASNYIIVEDYDLWLQLANKKARFFFMNEVLGEYIIDSDNISSVIERIDFNQRQMLSIHVFNIQTFEVNKNKLWKDVANRLDIEKIQSLVGSKRIIEAFFLSLRIIFNSPLRTIKTISGKLKFKIRSKL
ncbi:glycosyltransferase [Leptospira levettii]|uniref:glycosyltransferase n=1 Tax=Leptospira levettii TaxID=2023178 RepID=UPI00223E6ADB|nr:glycosyltransferase [Leptospira levettii]MCW7497036.1 glycosyltransferase [Leptospira levettii]